MVDPVKRMKDNIQNWRTYLQAALPARTKCLPFKELIEKELQSQTLKNKKSNWKMSKRQRDILPEDEDKEAHESTISIGTCRGNRYLNHKEI